MTQSHFIRPNPDPGQLDRVIHYLVAQRGLSHGLITPLIQSGSLYADRRANAVFLLRDPQSLPVGAELRGTTPSCKPFNRFISAEGGQLILAPWACAKTGWRIDAYVMMSNHYHLLIETPEGNLVAGMKWLQGTYTQRYNSRHSVFGHLFQGRYEALVVDGAAGNYIGVVSTYIHLNPARAGLIVAGDEPLAGYRWSGDGPARL